MDKVIIIDTGEIISVKEIGEVAAKHSVFLQESVWEAFRAAENKEYEKAEELCRIILDAEVQPEIQMLLGTCYFMQGNFESAEAVFSDLVHTDPGNEDYLTYYGMTEHAMGNHEKAVKIFESAYPLNEYRPFYYTCYGDSLQAVGRTKQARDAFYKDVEFYKEARQIFSPVMLDGAFQNLLHLDVILGNGQYPEDVKIYYDFLDQIEMTDQMKGYLSGNIVYLCELMGNKWYRPLFLEFITYIRDREFLAGSQFESTLESAFSSWESYEYHDDRQISSMMEDYLASVHGRKYGMEDAILEEDRVMCTVRALSYEWYMCQYLPEHWEEVDYVKKMYPHAYADSEAFFERVKDDAACTAQKLLDELLPYSHGTPRQELEESMYEVYKKASTIQKEAAYVYSGDDSYRRMQPKVGRNDPCPCGSGKKYKKCCGR